MGRLLKDIPLDRLGEVGPWSQAMARVESVCRPRRTAALASLLSSTASDDIGPVVAFTAGVLLPETEHRPIIMELATIARAFEVVTGLPRLELDRRAERLGGYPALALHTVDAPQTDATTLREVRDWVRGLLNFSREPLELLVFLLRNLPPRACFYIFRALQGEAPVGLDVPDVIAAIAEASRLEEMAVLRSCYVTNDIEGTAIRAREGLRPLAQVRCRTGRPYRMMAPMAVCSATSLFQWAGGRFFVEPAVPGVRLQIHRLHSSFRLHTLSLLDVTAGYPELCAALERGLRGTDDVILEGIAYLRDAPPEASLRTALSRISAIPSRRGEALIPEPLLSLALCDLIRQGREDLMPRPCAERRTRLAALLKPSDRIQLAPFHDAPSGKDIEESLRSCLPESRNTTRLLTPVGSSYVAGSRDIWYLLMGETTRCRLAGLVATLNAEGRLGHVTLAVRVRGGHTLVGRLSPSGADKTQWSELEERVRAHTVLQKGQKLLLRPGLILEVSPGRVRHRVRGWRGLAVSGWALHQIRDDMGTCDADDADQLFAVLSSLVPLQA